VAILVGSRDHQTQFWKGAIQGPFHQSLVAKMSSNFNCSYMAKSSLTYVRGFSVKFFFQPIYTDYANYAYFDKTTQGPSLPGLV
jgi:trehalose utilization protein